MNKFKVGDKIRVVRNNSTLRKKDELIGGVFTIKKDYGLAPFGNGTKYGIGEYFVVFDNEIEPATDRYELHITCNDGKTTNAVYKVNGEIKERKQAICAPSDTFDFATGAQTAFNRALYGTDYNPAEVALTKPAQTKAKPIKLYCVKDFLPNKFITKGKVYVAIKNFAIVFDDGRISDKYSSFEDFCEQNPSFASCLIPLVSRPAKVGEWIYITKHGDWNGHQYSIGEIHQVDHINTHDSTRCYYHYCQNDELFLAQNSYLVLDGYKPEPEEPIFVTTSILKKLGACSGDMAEFLEKFPSGEGEFAEVCKKACGSSESWLRANKDRIKAAQGEPEYYNGKVVCVEWVGDCFTVGKVYEVINGRMKANTGVYATPIFKTINDVLAYSGKWVEFKGE